jgi:hypothetical protein
MPFTSTRAIAFLFASLIGCIPPQPTTPTVVTMSGTMNVGGPGGSEVEQSEPPAPYSGRPILVVTDKRLPRPTELLGVLDFHSNATDENKGFDELRAHAAAMGADAVIGAEFEHGEGNEPSHLSGMVVRFLDR